MEMRRHGADLHWQHFRSPNTTAKSSNSITTTVTATTIHHYHPIGSSRVVYNDHHSHMLVVVVVSVVSVVSVAGGCGGRWTLDTARTGGGVDY